MKLIIDIPEEDYIRLRDEGMFGNVTTFKRAVREGIPLDQEPCDAVSRKEVMNMLHNHAFDYATSTKILALLKTMCGEVDRMPSVIPQYTEAEIQRMQELEQAEIQKAYELGKAEQPKMGRWIRELIRNEKGGCIGAKMICSECGNDNKHDEYMSYCPNCGKKMQKKMQEVQK